MISRIQDAGCRQAPTEMAGGEWRGKLTATISRRGLLLLLVLTALLISHQPLTAETSKITDKTLVALAAYVQELDAAGATVAQKTIEPKSTQAWQPADSESPNAAWDSDDGMLSELRAYAQTLPPEAGSIRLAKAEQPSAAGDDDAYADLRAFAQRIETNPSQTAIGDSKLADAGSLLEWLQQGAPPTPPPPGKAPAPPEGAKMPAVKAPLVAATNVGAKVCLGCHASQAAAFGYTLMGRLQKQGKLECETCHGPGSAHVKAGGGRGVGGIISFRPNDPNRTAEENNAICLTCHARGERAYWPGSVHEERGLFCTNCHTIMREVSARHQLKTAFQPDTCFQCHKDRRAQMFMSSHMPIREGKVVCSDCHNPHGSPTESLIREASINDNCYKCHAEKRGPFLFEHAPVRENCLNCHDPHGSINEFSLKMSRPRLCFECHSIGHAEATGINSTLTMGLACQNCHLLIHGSNSPAGGVLQR